MMICHVNTAQLAAVGTFLMCWDLGLNLGILKISTLLYMGFKGGSEIRTCIYDRNRSEDLVCKYNSVGSW